MDIKRILNACDHTLLSVDATWAQIAEVIDDAIHYEAASVCLPPGYVARAKEYAGDAVRICTVVGFPNGYATTAAKVFEAAGAVLDGADEIDMVINIGWLKDGLCDAVADEITAVKSACEGRVLKVIVETCLLTDAEKITMCRIVTETGADFIKTSTGFSTGGATLRDIVLFAGNIGPDVRIKAAGGITSLEDAEKFLDAGAQRLGTSRIIKLLKNEDGGGY
ncbi:MAG: deoxyribose-phosphate aldolase [Oscillospiraceae bacterium]|jgi:deoxyribose-phosphate aldolase|nr:deoxyribose-phosphate aldolase [Oscillospiraceae bacterium]